MTDDRNYGNDPNSINRKNVSAALGNMVEGTTRVRRDAHEAELGSLSELFCDPQPSKIVTIPRRSLTSSVIALQHERLKIQETGLQFQRSDLFDLPGGPVQGRLRRPKSERALDLYQYLQNDNTDNTAI